MLRTKSRRDNGDGWISPERDGYRARLVIGYDPATGKAKTKSARTKTHKEALEAIRKMQSEFRSGHLLGSSRETCEKFLLKWVETKVRGARSAATYRQYRWIIEYHVLPVLGRKPLEKVTRADVQGLITAKMGQTVMARGQVAPKDPKTLSHDTLRLIRAVLHAAYQDAVKDGLVSRNPAEFVDLPKKVKRPPVSLSGEEVGKLLSELQGDPLEAFWTFLLFTGCRLSEASGLRWQDVSIPNGVALISGQLHRVDRKLTRVEGTKTNQIRTVALPDSLLRLLEELQVRRMVDAVEDPDGLVFLNEYGRRLDPKYVRDRLTNLCEQAGTKVVSPHKLRHTFATLALGETGDLHAVQKALGHSQQSLTADLYAHGTLEGKKRLGAAIEGFRNADRQNSK